MRTKVFCDIVGTFTNGIDRDEAIKTFVDNLLNLDTENEISFSFVSNNDMPDVLKHVKELIPYIKDTRIILDNQYSYDKKFDGVNELNASIGKNAQIYEEIKEKKYDNVIYIDDTMLNAIITENYIKTKLPYTNIITLIPDGGIDSTNELLNNLIKKKHRI